MMQCPIVITAIAILLSLSSSLGQTADTVIGCGGFIRWKVQKPGVKLKFDQLKVSLFVEHTNTLKSVTDVLPNGAYSIALYDEGLYRLKLTTPLGWHTTHPEGYLLDLRSNPKVCTEDFDFEILGFTIFGQVVTAGLSSGPTGLTVKLTSADGSALLIRNRTQDAGYFSISPIGPGNYVLTISDGDQHDTDHIRAQSSVIVSSDSVHLSEPIVLLGHFLRGRVVDFDKQPLPDVEILLLTKTNQSNEQYSAITKEISDELKQVYLTHKQQDLAKTDPNGYFNFDRLPGGNYALVPRYTRQLNGASIPVQFDFYPAFLNAVMEHTDVDLGPQTFTLKSFQLKPGRILWPNQKPVQSAQITIERTNRVYETDANGAYQLGALTPGQYKLRVQSKYTEFEPLTVKLTPELTSLPDIKPSKVAMHGRVVPAKGVLSSQMDFAASLIIRNAADNTEIMRTQLTRRDDGFEFDLLLKPGLYSIQPDVKLKRSINNVQDVRFTPLSLNVDLSNGPVRDLMFTQFKAKLTGQLICLLDCSSLIRIDNAAYGLYAQMTDVNTSPGSSPAQLYPLQISKTTPTIANFQAENVLPGDYIIDLVIKLPDSKIISIDGWSWNSIGTNSSQTISASSARLLHVRAKDLDFTTDAALQFVQTGFMFSLYLDLPDYYSADSMPEILVRASSEIVHANKTSKKTLIWALNKVNHKIHLPHPNQVYTLDVYSPCAQFSRPSPAEIIPSKHSHHQLSLTKTIHIRPTKLAAFVQLKCDAPSNLHKLIPDIDKLFQSPIKIGIANLDDVQKAKPDSIQAKWIPSSPNEFPMATTSLWVDLDKTIQLSVEFPKPKTSKLFAFLAEPLFRNLKLKSSPANTESSTMSLSSVQDFLLPLEDTKNSRFTTANSPNPHADCAPTSDEQTAQFDVQIAINLLGKIDSKVEGVQVKLHRNRLPLVPTIDSENVERPLLPVHSTDEGSDVVPTTDETKTVDESTSVISTIETDSQGLFVFKPFILNKSELEQISNGRLSELLGSFEVTLNKPGYRFDVNPGKPDSQFQWLVKATKLSLVEVSVSRQTPDDKSQEPLEGVLISIIGEGHRANQLSDANGLVRFVGLAPGDYYLRPMMKEYSFNVLAPDSSKSGQAIPVTVTEGISVIVRLLANRIAFSASGKVTSLADIPEPDVIIEAVWSPSIPPTASVVEFDGPNLKCPLKPSDAPTIPREQSVTNMDGQFRIRGLVPGCIYTISVPIRKSANADRKSIERAIPDSIFMKMPQYDTTGLHFYGIRQLYMSILTVSVDTSDEFLGHLKLNMIPTSSSGGSLSTESIAKHHFGQDSLLFSLSGAKLGALVGRDYIIRLENDLKPSFYSNISTQEILYHPELDKSEHFTFVFRPVLRSTAGDHHAHHSEF